MTPCVPDHFRLADDSWSSYQTKSFGTRKDSSRWWLKEKHLGLAHLTAIWYSALVSFEETDDLCQLHSEHYGHSMIMNSPLPSKRLEQCRP
jgi:hypothetical protein